MSSSPQCTLNIPPVRSRPSALSKTCRTPWANLGPILVRGSAFVMAVECPWALVVCHLVCSALFSSPFVSGVSGLKNQLCGAAGKGPSSATHFNVLQVPAPLNKIQSSDPLEQVFPHVPHVLHTNPLFAASLFVPICAALNAEPAQ